MSTAFWRHSIDFLPHCPKMRSQNVAFRTGQLRLFVLQMLPVQPWDRIALGTAQCLLRNTAQRHATSG